MPLIAPALVAAEVAKDIRGFDHISFQNVLSDEIDERTGRSDGVGFSVIINPETIKVADTDAKDTVLFSLTGTLHDMQGPNIDVDIHGLAENHGDDIHVNYSGIELKGTKTRYAIAA